MKGTPHSKKAKVASGIFDGGDDSVFFKKNMKAHNETKPKSTSARWGGVGRRVEKGGGEKRWCDHTLLT